MNRDAQEPEKIKKAIEDMERRYETTSLKNPAEERKLIQDIKTMKATLPNAERLLALKPQIDKLYAEKKEIRQKLD